MQGSQGSGSEGDGPVGELLRDLAATPSVELRTLAETPPAVKLAALIDGSVFHDCYDVVRCIRTGGMGAIYEVIHRGTQRRRALKIMLPSVVKDSQLRLRFKLEATVAANVQSEHIVETFDAGVDSATGIPFLVMELLRGEDLERKVVAHGPFAPLDVLTLISQAALALDKTHAAGIVHRDLKPENLFATVRDDGSPWLKILDFGIAKIVAQSGTTAERTATIGTPLYMSPEQARGFGIGPRSDLYALGHIVYTLLVGEAYWSEEARTTEEPLVLLARTAQGAKEPASARARRRGVALPTDFDIWFAKATNVTPQMRFESASEMVTTLARVLGVQVPGILTSTPSTIQPRARLGLAAFGGLIVFIAAVAVVIGLRLPSSESPSSPTPSATPMAVTTDTSPLVPTTADAPIFSAAPATSSSGSVSPPVSSSASETYKAPPPRQKPQWKHQPTPL